MFLAPTLILLEIFGIPDGVEYDSIQYTESTVLPVYYTKYNVLLALTVSLYQYLINLQ